MLDYRETILNIKSDILAILVNSNDKDASLFPFLKIFQFTLKKYFKIDECAFLLFEDNNLFPINCENVSKIKMDSISWTVFQPFFYNSISSEVPNFLKENKAFSSMTHMILCKTSQDEPTGILLVNSSREWNEFTHTFLFEEVIELFANVIYKSSDTMKLIENEKQYRKLYDMTELFHSTMDSDLILDNVFSVIQDNFKNLEVNLILSTEHDQTTSINYKLFDYISERPSTIEAFVSGEITIEHAEELNQHLLNAPIKGNQGIYGILQVYAPLDYVFTYLQKDFIRKLANTSGNALENAKLYHQSHRLVSDLQMINETSQRLNSRITIEEMLSYLRNQLMKSFQPSEVGFVTESDGKFKVADSSSGLFKKDEGLIYLQYAEKHFSNSLDSLFIADFNRLIKQENKYRSIMAIPMTVEERITGFCIVLHEESYFFSFDSFKLMQSLIHHSSLAISNTKLRSQLQEMVDRDHLTKLFARSYLDRYLEQSLQSDDAGMFLLIDIDNFKSVNDTYGHQIGDKILVQIANELINKIGARGICARWGGEELAIYVPNIIENEAHQLANQLVLSVPNVTTPTVTISAGLVIWEKSIRPSYQNIFLQADTALYAAKHNGKNQVCLYDESLQSL